MNTHNHAEPFGPVIYSYTRAQAVANGFQIEVTKTATEAGIRFPVFLTRSVYDAYVTVPPSVTCQDEAGRLGQGPRCRTRPAAGGLGHSLPEERSGGGHR